MIGTDDEGDYSLQISSVALEDDAVFQCQVGAVEGVKGIRSHQAQFTVYGENHADSSNFLASPNISENISADPKGFVVYLFEHRQVCARISRPRCSLLPTRTNIAFAVGGVPLVRDFDEQI